MIPLYVILGVANSGRREIVANLLRETLEPDERACVYLSINEPESDGDDILAKQKVLEVAEYSSVAEIVSDDGPSHGAFNAVVIILDGTREPTGALESLSELLREGDSLELARILGVVHCRMANMLPEAKTYFDGVVHFSDVVLLNCREGVSNKWMDDYQKAFERERIPSLFEMVKRGRVNQPQAILFPEARRLTHIFDDDSDLAGDADEEWGEVEYDHDGVDGVPIEEAPESGADPYLDAHDDGRRKKPLPDPKALVERFSELEAGASGGSEA